MELRSTLRLPALLFLLLPALPGAAAPPPDAGEILEGIGPPPSPLRRLPAEVLPEPPVVPPATRPLSEVRIPVRGIRIRGAAAFPEAELSGLLGDAVGRELLLAELHELAERITRHYRAHGYLLARAYVPAQTIEGGIVTFAVLEGRLGEVRIDNRSALAPEMVAGRLALFERGAMVRNAELERSLLLLDDLPGVEVRSVLRPGASVGTADLDIQLEEGRRFRSTLDLNNYGDRYTGDYRAGLALAVDNPSGWGDALMLRGITSADGLDYGRIAYQLPVGAAGSRLGGAYSRVGYELGGELSALQAHGSADIASLYLLHPFLRGRLTNLDGQLLYEYKELDDLIDATATHTSREAELWTLGLSGDHLDFLAGGGLTNWSLGLVTGRLGLDPASRALDAAGHRTEGHYLKLNYELARLQRIDGRFSVYGRLSGQWAGDNLDSSEKFPLGGPFGVRAYPQSEAYADDGWLLNLELRYVPAPDWHLTAFADGARGHLYHAPIPADGETIRTLSGVGLGVGWSPAADLTLSATCAWGTSGAPTSGAERSPRLWFQLAKHF